MKVEDYRRLFGDRLEAAVLEIHKGICEQGEPDGLFFLRSHLLAFANRLDSQISRIHQALLKLN